MTEKARMRIADLVDLLPSVCWPDLVAWAYGYMPFYRVRINNTKCDLYEDGRCHCGKVGNKAASK